MLQRFLLPLLSLAAFSLLQAEPASPLKNPDFKTFGSDGIPESWKAYPPPDGTTSFIRAATGGGVQLVDPDEKAGVGLAQWIPVTAGSTVTAAMDATGSGNISLYVIFVPSIPSKEAQVGKVKLGETSINSSKGSSAKLTAVAPQRTTQARVWLYCPKIGKCDLVVKSVTLSVTPGDPSAAPLAAAPPAPKPTPVYVASPDSILQTGAISTIDFETGDFSQVRTQEGGKKEIVTEPVRQGKYAMKASMTHSDHRSEITGLRSESYGEYKYGWSIFLPTEFDGNSWFSIVTQWHSWGTGKDYVISPPGPPTCLVIAKNAWTLQLRYQDGDTDKATQKIFPLGSIEPDRGKWTDYMMEVNWQSPKTGGGYLRMYKNGEKLIDYNGPTWYDDKTSGPFFKMGIYKGAGSWKGEENGAVLYFDNFHMAGKTASLADVDPSVEHAAK